MIRPDRPVVDTLLQLLRAHDIWAAWMLEPGSRRLSGWGQRPQELQLGLQSDPLLVNHLEPTHTTFNHSHSARERKWEIHWNWPERSLLVRKSVNDYKYSNIWAASPWQPRIGSNVCAWKVNIPVILSSSVNNQLQMQTGFGPSWATHQLQTGVTRLWSGPRWPGFRKRNGYLHVSNVEAASGWFIVLLRILCCQGVTGWRLWELKEFKIFDRLLVYGGGGGGWTPLCCRKGQKVKITSICLLHYLPWELRVK